MMFMLFMYRTFDAEGSVFGVVCLVASVEIQRSCWGFHDMFSHGFTMFSHGLIF